jgi:hypothetical protein
MKAKGSPTQDHPEPSPPPQPQLQENRSFRLQLCHKPLRTNPYTAYRDETGKWVVVRNF